MGNKLQRSFNWGGIFIGMLVFVIALWVGNYVAKMRAVEAEATRGQRSAALLTASFRRELEKFRLASVVLALEGDVTGVFDSDPLDPNLLEALNGKLELISNQTEAAAVYLIRPDGVTIASSNSREPTSFVGSNYSFRAYFREALNRGEFEQFALGSVSRRPGLYIGRRVEKNGQILGVVVIKVEFDGLESEWSEADNLAFATNDKGVILVTSVPDWRFQTISRLSVEDQSRSLRNLDFGDKPLSENTLYKDELVSADRALIDVSRPYLDIVNRLDRDWSVHVLIDTSHSIRSGVLQMQAAIVAFFMFLVAAGSLLYYRRNTLKLRAERQLNERLRVMNERLVQANKLATLGQIAAGVGHEINQPLAAIGSYADSARKLLVSGKNETADENLSRISELTERIGRITGELRGFSRKASGLIEPVNVMVPIEGALLLMNDRLDSMRAEVRFTNPGEVRNVMAESVRLEQVFVNLFQNSLEAGGDGTIIEISFKVDGTRFVITIADNGPGLSEHVRENLFRPFSTSKRDGLGLGLVISRDILAEFGGELTAEPSVKGAVFSMRMKIAS
nr:ATP-binding protein [uncultured Hyphomonas sp.]